MSNIEKVSKIEKCKLSQKNYFQSLIEEGYIQGLITQLEIENIQYQCLDLLSNKVELYNGGNSSSVRVDIAKSIMNSNIYTFGIFLKEFDNPDEAVEQLKQKKIKEIYNIGRKKIDTKLNSARYLFYKVLKNKIQTQNDTYNLSMTKGIKGFFKIYNPDYEAQDIRITADYPLYNPISDLDGIEFMQKYLESIYYENIFCNYFSSEAISHLLYGYNKEYEELIINIFEILFITTIGCKLAKNDITTLYISKAQIEYIYCILSEKSREEIKDIVTQKYDEIRDELFKKEKSLQLYIEKKLDTVASMIYNAVQQDTLDKIFIIPKYPQEDEIESLFETKIDDLNI